MNEYLHNRLIKLIAPKSVMEVEFSFPYDGNNSKILYPKEIDERLNKALNFNFGKDSGLKKIINYFLS